MTPGVRCPKCGNKKDIRRYDRGPRIEYSCSESSMFMRYIYSSEVSGCGHTLTELRKDQPGRIKR